MQIHYRDLTIESMNPRLIEQIGRMTPRMAAAPKFTTEQRLTKMLQSGTRMFAAFDEDRLVGVVVVALALLLTDNRAWIADLIIDEVYSDKDIDYELLSMAEAASEKAGAGSLSFIPTPEQVPTCERLGYDSSLGLITFTKKL